MKRPLQPLKVSDNHRFLVQEDDTPFFWMGDTAWELFHKLTREDAETYLKIRAGQGFNVIQAVALSEFDGLKVSNAYDRSPLLKNEAGLFDPDLPDLAGPYSYWDHVDAVIDLAAEHGIYCALLPTWGDKYNMSTWGKGPEIFTPENAFRYGRWIADRYRDRSNIIWVLGGDRPLETHRHFGVISEMARGIRAGDGGAHLITFHPTGNRSSSYHNHDEAWLDFNMIQSGHGALNAKNYDFVEHDYAQLPVKPTLDGEPRYEDHPINFNPDNGYYDDFDVRQAAYWAVFAGSFGHTYGHHSVWSMCTEPAAYIIMKWQTALVRPGATHMQHLRRLIESRPFLERIPDQSLIAVQYGGANHLQATRGEQYAMIYSPCGLLIQVAMGRIAGRQVQASWFDPRTGVETVIGDFDNTGVASFMPPSSGRNNDWVLLLEKVD